MHPGKRAFLAQLAIEINRELAEERAAILEFDAGYTREEAERIVREGWQTRQKQGTMFA